MPRRHDYVLLAWTTGEMRFPDAAEEGASIEVCPCNLPWAWFEVQRPTTRYKPLSMYWADVFRMYQIRVCMEGWCLEVVSKC